MKPKKGWQYDEAYDKNIADWEDFLRYSRLSAKRNTWYLNLLFPFLLTGFGFAGLSWTAWVGILGLYLVFVKVFSFFEELNENMALLPTEWVKSC